MKSIFNSIWVTTGIILLLGVQLSVVSLIHGIPVPDEVPPAKPLFVDGQAQVVEEFKDPEQWIQHDLWVETTFDTDGDGKLDRMHVDVTRQRQTETEALQVPVIYESSPYFSGTGSNDKKYSWDPSHEVGEKPPRHESPPPMEYQSKRPLMSRRQIERWVPRGFAVVHSASPGR